MTFTITDPVSPVEAMEFEFAHRANPNYNQQSITVRNNSTRENLNFVDFGLPATWFEENRFEIDPYQVAGLATTSILPRASTNFFIQPTIATTQLLPNTAALPLYFDEMVLDHGLGHIESREIEALIISPEFSLTVHEHVPLGLTNPNYLDVTVLAGHNLGDIVEMHLYYTENRDVRRRYITLTNTETGTSSDVPIRLQDLYPHFVGANANDFEFMHRANSTLPWQTAATWPPAGEIPVGGTYEFAIRVADGINRDLNTTTREALFIVDLSLSNPAPETGNTVIEYRRNSRDLFMVLQPLEYMVFAPYPEEDYEISFSFFWGQDPAPFRETFAFRNTSTRLPIYLDIALADGVNSEFDIRQSTNTATGQTSFTGIRLDPRGNLQIADTSLDRGFLVAPTTAGIFVRQANEYYFDIINVTANITHGANANIRNAEIELELFVRDPGFYFETGLIGAERLIDIYVGEDPEGPYPEILAYIDIENRGQGYADMTDFLASTCICSMYAITMARTFYNGVEYEIPMIPVNGHLSWHHSYWPEDWIEDTIYGTRIHMPPGETVRIEVRYALAPDFETRARANNFVVFEDGRIEYGNVPGMPQIGVDFRVSGSAIQVDFGRIEIGATVRPVQMVPVAVSNEEIPLDQLMTNIADRVPNLSNPSQLTIRLDRFNERTVDLVAYDPLNPYETAPTEIVMYAGEDVTAFRRHIVLENQSTREDIRFQDILAPGGNLLPKDLSYVFENGLFEIVNWQDAPEVLTPYGTTGASFTLFVQPTSPASLSPSALVANTRTRSDSLRIYNNRGFDGILDFSLTVLPPSFYTENTVAEDPNAPVWFEVYTDCDVNHLSNYRYIYIVNDSRTNLNLDDMNIWFSGEAANEFEVCEILRPTGILAPGERVSLYIRLVDQGLMNYGVRTATIHIQHYYYGVNEDGFARYPGAYRTHGIVLNVYSDSEIEIDVDIDVDIEVEIEVEIGIMLDDFGLPTDLEIEVWSHFEFYVHEGQYENRLVVRNIGSAPFRLDDIVLRLNEEEEAILPINPWYPQALLGNIGVSTAVEYVFEFRNYEHLTNRVLNPPTNGPETGDFVYLYIWPTDEAAGIPGARLSLLAVNHRYNRDWRASAIRGALLLNVREREPCNCSDHCPCGYYCNCQGGSCGTWCDCGTTPGGTPSWPPSWDTGGGDGGEGSGQGAITPQPAEMPSDYGTDYDTDYGSYDWLDDFIVSDFASDMNFGEQIVVPIGSSTIYRHVLEANGGQVVTRTTRIVEMDTTAYITPDTYSTMIPIRFVGYILDLNVYWCDETRMGELERNGRRLRFYPDSYYMYVNDVRTPVLNTRGEPVRTVLGDNGRMYIPLRAMGEAVGLEAEWINDIRTALLHIQRISEGATGWDTDYVRFTLH